MDWSRLNTLQHKEMRKWSSRSEKIAIEKFRNKFLRSFTIEQSIENEMISAWDAV